jgi:hypothetical protein
MMHELSSDNGISSIRKHVSRIRNITKRYGETKGGYCSGGNKGMNLEGDKWNL